MNQQAFGAQGDVEFQRRLYSDPNATRRGLHCARRDWVLEQAMTHSRPGAKVLEVGVGCGIFTEALSAAGRKVTAVDINPAFLANVSSLEHVSTFLKDATAPLDLGAHDLAICSEVLEHVPPERSLLMLKSLHDSLAPGGVLILTTPQRYSTAELAARLLKLPLFLRLARRLYGSADELGHINLLTTDQLRRQAEAAGFRRLSQRRFGLYLPVIAEFGGTAGAKALQVLERMVRAVPGARALLWTQGWVLSRPS